MPTFTATVMIESKNFDVKCEVCGSDRLARVEEENLVIYVYPCSECIESAKSELRDELSNP